MFALRKQRMRNFVMGVGRRRDRCGIYHCREFFQRLCGGYAKFFRDRLRFGKIDIVDRGELGGRNIGIKSGVIAPDMPNAHNADAKFCHDATFFKNHSYVCAIPSRSEMVGRQPRFFSFVTSRSLRGVPSGLLVSQAKSPSKPTMSQISSANSRIEMSSPQPTLMISGESYF